MRILLKISGQALGEKGEPWRGEDLLRIGGIIYEMQKGGKEVAVVVGGGNVWRYRDQAHLPLERVASDYLGMLATVFNAVCLREAVKKAGGEGVVFSRVRMPKQLGEDYEVGEVKEALGNGKVVLLAGGTGKSGFTTDTGAALFAKDLGCDELWKATKVEGVYDGDPEKEEGARFYEEIGYGDYLEKKLGVMDLEAVEVCRDGEIPIRVFRFSEEVFRSLEEEKAVGSWIK